ncbi:uncharacterized protein LOC111402035 isoform X2 [Olea europaea var. sylvestris]|uniref:uncharacterized protein LOC111402035 isoform X2 n=1 Tax=Olea europaea var. sylvestris TaxID=158386 RepID=UPI000C1CDC4C|nr:uncharacterized protein LOC111402035 isoform X2 [Olea europaea var. sylvestris]
MAAAIGWYGPLIDLCKASSNVGGYVQILVYVHKSTPIQYKILRNGGEVVRTDILVGDDTRAYFPVTIWQKQTGSKIVAGHVILLQNVRIARFGDAFEARTLPCSSLQCLLNPSDILASKGIDQLIEECSAGIATKDKLRKVLEWVRRTGLIHGSGELNYHHNRRHQEVNWKVHEETHSQDCISLLDLCELSNSCKATFHASVGEIFLPITWRSLHESEAERMFISRRLNLLGEKFLVDDLISIGCQLCGTPLNTELESSSDQNVLPLYCQKSSNRLHVVNTIYRPFMLYVWDDSQYIPLLVTNEAAEVLFGNIQASKVHSCYKSQNQRPSLAQNGIVCTGSRSCEGIQRAAKEELANPPPSGTAENIRSKEKQQLDEKTNFYMIWLIFLKMLLQPGKNSPLKFKVKVDTSREWESGRFEMVSVSMPAR